MDDQKQKAKERLNAFEFHANWDIENTSKSFQSIKQSIDEHLQDSESFTIEVRFLESYLHMSECKGMIKKDISKAMEINEKAFDLIRQLDDGPIKDGYMYIYLAMRCWSLLKKDQLDVLSYEDLEQLIEKYKKKNEDEDDKKKFNASICVTKALALSKLSFSRYDESECELKKATETCPRNAEWRFMLGLIKLRRYKISLKKNESSSSLTEVEQIMEEVLAMKTNQAYAMVILADIKRRKYEDNGLVVVEDGYDGEIIDLLTKSKENASRPKILSFVAQCYIHMGRYCRSKRNMSFREPDSPMIYFSKARNVIDFAKKNFKTAACIIAQEAVLYWEQENTKEELKCLDTVIDMKPSNVGARIQKAQALLSIEKRKETFELYDDLLVEFNDDKHPFDLFDINRNYATSLAYIKAFNKASDRNIACLEIALKSFVKQTSSLQVEFIKEEDKQVQKVIGHVKKHLEIERSKSMKFKNDPYKIKPSLDLAKFHDRLGQFEQACSYYKEALRALLRTSKAHDKNQEIDILLKLSNVNIKLGNLSDATLMLTIMKGMKSIEDYKDDVGELETHLAVAKGKRAAESGEHARAIAQFVRAAKMGSVEGSKRLIPEMKGITNHWNFFKNCALVEKCINAANEDVSMMNLLELVHSCDDVEKYKDERHLAVAKGKSAAESGEHARAIAQFGRAAKMCITEASKRLIQEMKGITNHWDFFKNCALVEKCINAANEDVSMMKKDLLELVHSYDDGCLMKKELLEVGLRKYQLEMELGYLNPDDPNNSMKIDTVIRKTRSVFNYAMTRFRDKHYSETKKNEIWRDTTDFFIVYGNANDVEKEIVKKITTVYKWPNFQYRFPSLLSFLVTIQPEIDPRNNKWIKEIFKLDNTVKHKYPLDAKQVSKNIDIARRACFRLRPILEEFCKYL